MRRYITAKVDTKRDFYIIEDCDSAYYDKESDSIKIHKGNSMIMIPYREVLAFRTTFKIEDR